MTVTYQIWTSDSNIWQVNDSYIGGAPLIMSSFSPWLNVLGKDNYETRREAFKFFELDATFIFLHNCFGILDVKWQQRKPNSTEGHYLRYEILFITYGPCD